MIQQLPQPRTPYQYSQPLIQSVGSQSAPAAGGTPLTLFAWKDGVIGVIDVMTQGGFKKLEL